VLLRRALYLEDWAMKSIIESAVNAPGKKRTLLRRPEPRARPAVHGVPKG